MLGRVMDHTESVQKHVISSRIELIWIQPYESKILVELLPIPQRAYPENSNMIFTNGYC